MTQKACVNVGSVIIIVRLDCQSKLEGMWKEGGHGPICDIIPYVPGGTEENHGNLSHISGSEFESTTCRQ